MTIYKKEHYDVKAAVKLLDKDLCNKASKVEYFAMRNQLEKFMTKEELEEVETEQKIKLNEFADEIVETK